MNEMMQIHSTKSQKGIIRYRVATAYEEHITKPSTQHTTATHLVAAVKDAGLVRMPVGGVHVNGDGAHSGHGVHQSRVVVA